MHTIRGLRVLRPQAYEDESLRPHAPGLQVLVIVIIVTVVIVIVTGN